MSLKIWLPLDGDLRNLGTSNGNFSIKTALTYTDNGKIGKACSGGTITIDANTTASILNNQEFSFTCWVYINSAEGSTSNRGMFFGNSNMGANNNRKFSIFQYPTCNDLHLSWMNDATSTVFIGTIWSGVFPSYKWTHVAVTYKNPNGTIYINGIKYATWSGISNSSSFEYETYLFQNAPDQTRYLNDYRIYDHCLSAAEVHEISQGLVLHYKLDGNNQNYCKNSNFFNGTTNWYGVNGSTITTTKINNVIVATGTKGTHDNIIGQTSTLDYIANSLIDITISADVYVEENGTFKIGNWISTTEASGWQAISGNRIYNTSNNLSTGWNKINSTLHNATNSYNGKVVVAFGYTGATFYITNIKLEIGQQATPWCPNSSDALYSILGYDTTIVEDSSGYGHNGKINDTTLKFVQDSARYASCMMNSQSNNSNTYPFYGECNIPESSEITFTWWMKPTSLGMQTSGIFSTSNLTSPTDYNTTAANMRDSHFDCCNTEGTCVRLNVAGFITLNEWHHYALTYNGTNLSFYKDGELKRTTAQTGSLKAFKYIFPFYSRAGGVSRTTSGYLSDFRIYCTPLLDNDIKMLYNVGMKVDNLQNLHTFELNENFNSTSLTKQGILKTANFYENGYQSILQYDKTIYIEPDGSTWAHIFHHNNPANSRFSNGTADWSEGIYLDENRWYDVEKILNNLIQYEFLVKQKTTDTATETKWRWIQNINPLEATWEDVGTNACTYITNNGYSTSNYNKGMYLFKTSNLHMCIANNAKGNWYGGIGACSIFNNGIPGYPNTTVTTGYIDLYVRIYPLTKIIKNVGINTLNFIEI